MIIIYVTAMVNRHCSALENTHITYKYTVPYRFPRIIISHRQKVTTVKIDVCASRMLTVLLWAFGGWKVVYIVLKQNDCYKFLPGIIEAIL